MTKREGERRREYIVTSLECASEVGGDDGRSRSDDEKGNCVSSNSSGRDGQSPFPLAPARLPVGTVKDQEWVCDLLD